MGDIIGRDTWVEMRIEVIKMWRGKRVCGEIDEKGGGMVNYLHFAHSWRDFAKSWVLLFGIIYEVL